MSLNSLSVVLCLRIIGSLSIDMEFSRGINGSDAEGFMACARFGLRQRWRESANDRERRGQPRAESAPRAPANKSAMESAAPGMRLRRGGGVRHEYPRV